jgi:methanethiol S-methyltransferase
MRRAIFFMYGVGAHALFLGVYAWMALFVGNVGWGRSIDGPPVGSLAGSLAVDALLVAVFCLLHSVMARPAFKSRWTRLVPEPIERSTYVLVSSLLMALLIALWRPLGGVVWHVTHPVGAAILQGLFAVGWLMIPAVSLLIDHFDLFGTRQVWLYLRNRPYTPRAFRTPGVYRFVRHPLYVGWLLAFWATPSMTWSHFAFSALFTAYILIAIPFEERDLVRHLGGAYERYRKSVGALIPRLRSRDTDPPVSARMHS